MKRLHYGWIVAAATMLLLLVTNGLIITGISAFDVELLETFDWSRGTLKFRDLLTFALAGLMGPFAGALADRFGVRRLMLFGAALLAVALVFYGRIQTAMHMYLVHLLFALVLVTCGLIVSIMLVSRWFTAKRGTAIGIALMGTSLGGMFFVPFSTGLLARLKTDTPGAEEVWRQAMTWEALFPVALVLLILLLIRDRPEDKGLEPYGGHPKATGTAGELPGLAYGEALRTGTFWALAFTAMATFYSILGFQGHLFLHLSDLNMSPGQGYKVLFGMALIGKFTFGLLADYFDHKRVFVANIAVMLTGALLLVTLRPDLLWTALVLFGLGWGGLYTLIQLLTVESFGLRASGKILGTITTLDAIGGGLGIWLTGLLHDRTGDYRAAFLVVAVLIGLALLASTQVRKVRYT